MQRSVVPRVARVGIRDGAECCGRWRMVSLVRVHVQAKCAQTSRLVSAVGQVCLRPTHSTGACSGASLDVSSNRSQTPSGRHSSQRAKSNQQGRVRGHGTMAGRSWLAPGIVVVSQGNIAAAGRMFLAPGAASSGWVPRDGDRAGRCGDPSQSRHTATDRRDSGRAPHQVGYGWHA